MVCSQLKPNSTSLHFMKQDNHSEYFRLKSEIKTVQEQVSDVNQRISGWKSQINEVKASISTIRGSKLKPQKFWKLLKINTVYAICGPQEFLSCRVFVQILNNPRITAPPMYNDLHSKLRRAGCLTR